MKIGVVTMFFNNYGALLQAYALQQTLIKLGHDAYVINRSYGKFRGPLSFKQRFFKWFDSTGFDNFRNKYIRLTKHINSKSELELINKEFDVIIAGSDQVWNCDCINSMEYYFYLDWVAPHIKKYSYAASFGKDSFDRTSKEIADVSRILKTFNGISVREKSGVDICKNILGVNADLLLDPTLLLSADDYSKLITSSEKKDEYICEFFLDSNPQKEDKVFAIAEFFHLDIVDNYNKSYDVKKARWNRKYRRPTISQWLRNIRDSKYVITDSFHGMVFSIIFGKQFVVFDNKKRGSARFISLLSLLGLECRLISANESIKTIQEMLITPIDYNAVRDIIASEKVRSSNFLSQI